MTPHATNTGPLYLGFDLSTQQLKGVVIHQDLTLVHEAKVDFDSDFGEKYGIQKGVLSNPAEGEIYAPNAMWLEALDLVLARLKEIGTDFSKVRGISGAGMQHGTVFWNGDAEKLLAGLDSKRTLVDQLGGIEGAFSHPDSPNWQDASTQKECEEFDRELGDPETLAAVTGSKAHHRFSGPQIMRFRRKYPEHYANTAHISLVSSFFASLLLGKIAPIDIGDVCGMNLWDIHKGEWHEGLRTLATEGTDPNGLAQKLGPVPEDGGGILGTICPYFVDKFGFNKDCSIAPFTGDNPSTILSLPLRPTNAMVSLGTSTTFLMSTPEYKPDPAYHFMNHPTTAGLYMFMLCYKNGSLAREYVRDAINSRLSTPPAQQGDWSAFNQAITESQPLLSSQDPRGEEEEEAKLALYFPRHEIVPSIPPGEWHFTYAAASHTLTPTSTPSQDPDTSISATPLPSSPWQHPHDDARAIVESQMLSLRLRSRALVGPQTSPDGSKTLPPQPRRVYLVGGASVNAAIAQVVGEVLGGAEGVYRLELGGNACALGAAYKAAWSVERAVHADAAQAGEVRGGRDTESFESFVGARWNEAEFVHKIDVGYREGVWERYGEVLDGFAEMERRVLKQTGEDALEEFPGGGKGLREW